MDGTAVGPADRWQAPSAADSGAVALARPPAARFPPARRRRPLALVGRCPALGPDGALSRVALRPDVKAEARGLDRERAALERDQAGGVIPVTATILVLPMRDSPVRRGWTTSSTMPTARPASPSPRHSPAPCTGPSPIPAARRRRASTTRPSTTPPPSPRITPASSSAAGLRPPIRAGDPNVNGGKGVDISGLTGRGLSSRPVGRARWSSHQQWRPGWPWTIRKPGTAWTFASPTSAPGPFPMSSWARSRT